MENFKSTLFLIIILTIVIIMGYWAVSTIEPGNVFVSREKQQALEQKNSDLEKEVEKLKNELATLQPEEISTPQTETPEEPTPNNPTPASKYQSLINDLQKLSDDKVYMKEKSRGTRVGTIQTFLNIYNNTSKKVDNDYGSGTKADIIKFQKAVGLTQSGETGPTTYQKMIEWLKKQGQS